MRFPVPRTGALSLPRLYFDPQEWSGAFGDLGLLVPIVAALVLSNAFTASSILLVFGGAYVLSALYYRLPMPVQPLKAMAAIAIAQGLGADVMSAGALLMATLLLALAGAGYRFEDGLHRPGLGVNDGKGFAFISYIGEVCPSGFLPLIGGNVRERPLADIYRRSQLFRDLRDPEKLKDKCGACEFRTVCGGSRARAWAVTGDYLAEDPSCVHRPAASQPSRSRGHPHKEALHT